LRGKGNRYTAYGYTKCPDHYARSDVREWSGVTVRKAKLLQSSRSDRARLRALARPYRWRIAQLSLASFVSGAIEAAFLVVVTRTAVAITNGRVRVGLTGAVFTPVSTALAVAAVLVAGRLVVTVVTSVISTNLTEDVATDLRGDLAGAFLDSNWSTQ